MHDAKLLIRTGWKSIWKQDVIWVFSALPTLSQFIIVYGAGLGKDTLAQLLGFGATLISSLLSLCSLIGVPFLAYSFWVGKPLSFDATISAIRRYAPRLIGCALYGAFVFSPFLCLAGYLAFRNFEQPGSTSGAMQFLLLFGSAFAAMWDFTLAGFFVNDSGIRKSMRKAWDILTSHFGALATVGVGFALLSRILSGSSAALTVLVQSGFDTTSLNGLDYVFLSPSVTSNYLFLFLSGIGQTTFTTLSASVFILAYLRYSGIKTQVI